jgi:hypothetical protein
MTECEARDLLEHPDLEPDIEALVARIHAAAGPTPTHIIIHPFNLYWLKVVAGNPTWLAMPFRILPGESRGRVEDRWRAKKAFDDGRGQWAR